MIWFLLPESIEMMMNLLVILSRFLIIAKKNLSLSLSLEVFGNIVFLNFGDQ